MNKRNKNHQISTTVYFVIPFSFVTLSKSKKTLLSRTYIFNNKIGRYTENVIIGTLFSGNGFLRIRF